MTPYRHLYLYLTHDCNAACTYCYRKDFVKKLDSKKRYMTRKVADDAIDFVMGELETLNAFTINLWGGEPFLNFEVLKYLVETYPQLAFFTNTNGLLIDESIYNWVKEHKNFTITWSMGNTWERYGSFEKKIEKEYWAYRVVKDMPRHRMNFSVASRYDKAAEDFKFLYKINKNVVFNIAYRMDHKDEDLKVLEDQYFKILTLDSAQTTVRASKLWAQEFGPKVEIQADFCRTGVDKLFIDIDGGIWGCDGAYMNQINPLGSIYTGLEKNKLKYFKTLDEHREKLDKYCDGCEIKGYCTENKCLNTNYFYTGDYLKPSAYHCKVQKTVYRVYKRYIEWYKENVRRRNGIKTK